jgi:hypothetical protein
MELIPDIIVTNLYGMGDTPAIKTAREPFSL